MIDFDLNRIVAELINQSYDFLGKDNFIHSIDRDNLSVPDGMSFEYIDLAYKLNNSKIEDIFLKQNLSLSLLYVKAINESRYTEEVLINKLKEIYG